MGGIFYLCWETTRYGCASSYNPIACKIRQNKKTTKFTLNCLEPELDSYQIIKLQYLNLRITLNKKIYREILPLQRDESQNFMQKVIQKLRLQGIVIGIGFSSKIANFEWLKMGVNGLFSKFLNFLHFEFWFSKLKDTFIFLSERFHISVGKWLYSFQKMMQKNKTDKFQSWLKKLNMRNFFIFLLIKITSNYQALMFKTVDFTGNWLFFK